METKIKWKEGDGYITATYEGSGSGSASISSDVNEGVDRGQYVYVETTKGDILKSRNVYVWQEGMRETFLPTDGDFVLADSGTFNVLKPPSELLRGVFIQDIDGNLYTENEWDGSKTPNGIAVLTDNCRFVIALENAHSSSCRWGGYGTTVSGITTTKYESEAQQDYDGEAQTTTIINVLKGTNDEYAGGAPAAEYCRAYTFPDGSTGYLGAAGEWQAALDNKSAIESALSKCGGESLSNYCWTSTQYSSSSSWYMNWGGEDLNYYGKYNYYYVRAFAAI